MTPTPFELSHQRAASIGARIVESLAINQMIVQAHAYEHHMMQIGNGTPPLSETLIIGSMWAGVGSCVAAEAEV